MVDYQGGGGVEVISRPTARRYFELRILYS